MKHGTATLPVRFAMIADVHGDLPSLQRVLAAIDRAVVEAIWCLGDIVGLGATDPADVVDLPPRPLRARARRQPRPLGRERPSARDAAAAARPRRASLATRPTLSRATRVARDPPVAYPVRRFSLWHGSATDPVTGWISSHADAADHLARQQTPVGLVGHTHRPLIASLSEGAIHFDERPQREHIPCRSRVVLNPVP